MLFAKNFFFRGYVFSWRTLIFEKRLSGYYRIGLILWCCG